MGSVEAAAKAMATASLSKTKELKGESKPVTVLIAPIDNTNRLRSVTLLLESRRNIKQNGKPIGFLNQMPLPRPTFLFTQFPPSVYEYSTQSSLVQWPIHT